MRRLGELCRQLSRSSTVPPAKADSTAPQLQLVGPSTTPRGHPSCRASGCSGSTLDGAIEVSAAGLDCGNIEVVKLSSPQDLCLRIRPDPPCAREDGKAHFHWFYFVARGLRGQRCTFKILNAGEASYAWKGWPSLEDGQCTV